MTKTIALCLIGYLVCFSSCFSVPSPPSSTGSTTFIIQEPLENDCFTTHQSSSPPSGTKIKVKVFLTTHYYDGQRRVELGSATSAETNSFPITLTATTPKDRPAEVDVIIEGLECSECALGQGGPDDPNTPCVAMMFVGSGNTPTKYQAAKPRWFGSYAIDNYVASKEISGTKRSPNVQNTCNSNCLIQ